MKKFNFENYNMDIVNIDSLRTLSESDKKAIENYAEKIGAKIGDRKKGFCKENTPPGYEYTDGMWFTGYRCEYDTILYYANRMLLNDYTEFLKSIGKCVYLRFGEIPASGRSYNFRDGFLENGISAFRAYKIGKNYAVDPAGGYFTYLGYVGSKTAYEVVGDEIDETGSDGEPLLKNAKIVKKVNEKNMFTTKQYMLENIGV